MGFLAAGNLFANQGASMAGQTAGALGMSTAAGAATASLGQGALATDLNMAGDLLSGAGTYQLGMYQAQVAQNNSTIAGYNVNAALAAGGVAEETSKIKTGQLIGEQKAGQGASGLDVNIGSTKAVRDSTQNIGDFDAAVIRYNAARQAYSYGIDQSNYKSQAGLYRDAAWNGLAKGVLDAGTSYLSGSSSLAAKYATYQDAGLHA